MHAPANVSSPLHRAGWPQFADAQRAAFAALAELPPAEPVTSVTYTSQGRLLIIGGDERAASAAQSLASMLNVTLLWTAAGAAPAMPGNVFTHRGTLRSLSGFLGAFEAAWTADEKAKPVSFDLVLDLQAEPALRMHQPPQGYWFAGDEAQLAKALAELPDAVGEFEKPKFFAYKDKICAHSRSEKTGCTACIDVCSTSAIESAGDTVKVNPHLCMGCGACAAVCPSGAMTYQYPRMTDRGAQLKAMLAAFRSAGGQDAVVLIHNESDGAAVIESALAALPGSVLPFAAWHVASVGLDALLAAVSFGAARVAILAAGSEAPQYRTAIEAQFAQGEAILRALGYGGTHFRWIAASDGASLSRELANWAVPATPAQAAVFALANDKRTTIEFCVEHLMKHAPSPVSEIALPAGAAYGHVNVNRDTCTLCMACAGACPESALMDTPGEPKLRFVERNCVQCGICEKTCPENAISLTPRLLLTKEVREPRVLNEDQPFNCVNCGKPFGVKRMIDTMTKKLAGHSMFAGEGTKRLQMCADCRVVDMMFNKNERSALDL